LLLGLGTVLVVLVAWSWHGTVREEIALLRLRAAPGVTIVKAAVEPEFASWSRTGFFDLGPIRRLSETYPDGLQWLFRLRLASYPKLVKVTAAAPRWVFAEVGRLNGVVELNLSNSSVTDEVLAQAIPHRFRGILSLSGTAIGDSGLQRLAGLQVYCLDLSGTRVTDAGLASLATFQNLYHLGLSSTRITGATLSELQRLPSLETLCLQDTSITDRSLSGLTGHPGLESVYLSRTPVHDAALSILATLPNCRFVDLSDTRVTGLGLSRLSRRGTLRMVKLDRCPLETSEVIASNLETQHLSLNETPLGDKIVPWLLTRRCLRGVWLEKSAITNRGLTALRGSDPRFRISLAHTAIDDAGVGAFYLGEYPVPDTADADRRSLLIDEIAAAHAATFPGSRLSAWSLRETCVSQEILSVLDPY